MKKILCLILGVLSLSFAVRGQYVTVPDTAFYKILKTNSYPGCFTGTNLMDTTCMNTISMPSSLYIDDSNVYSIEGSQYLKTVTSLYMSGTHVTSVAAWPPALNSLVAGYNNNLTTIQSFPGQLQQINLDYDTSLTALPTLPSGLISLSAFNCHLTSLPTLRANASKLV